MTKCFIDEPSVVLVSRTTPVGIFDYEFGKRGVIGTIYSGHDMGDFSHCSLP
jgi:hypothetical protein